MPVETAMFKNMEGQPVPAVTFRTRNDSEWVELSSDDVFAGKTVVVFSLPGAFTPTCSSAHVPVSAPTLAGCLNILSCSAESPARAPSAHPRIQAG